MIFSTFVADVTTDLFINALLPPTRKLISLPLRGADWKALRKNQEIDETTKERIYAYWHFEASLKEQYFGECRATDSTTPNQNQSLFILFFLRISPKRSSGDSGQPRCEQKSGNHLCGKVTFVLAGEGATAADDASE